MENVKAYPSGQQSSVHNPYAEALNEGMNLRDYFAGQALAGMLACDTTWRAFAQEGMDKIEERTTKSAYRFADAMMQARAK